MTQEQQLELHKNALFYGMGILIYQIIDGRHEMRVVPIEDYKPLADALVWSAENRVQTGEKDEPNSSH